MFPTPPVHEEEPRDECPGCVAPADCHAHRVDWRARAIAAEIRAEEAEAHGAKSDALIDAICQRVGARDTGCGGQTVEACEMRRRMNMTQRIDMLTTAAARWAKVAPLIERLRHTRRHAKPDIVVTALDNLLAATEDAP